MYRSTDRGFLGFRARWLGLPGGLAILAAALASAAGSRPAEAMEQLTEEVVVPSPEHMTEALVALSARLQTATDAERPAVARRLRALAATRRQLLEVLAEEEPEAVVRAALAGALRAQLPAGVRRYVERQVTLEGELQVMVEDQHRSSRTHYILRTRSGRHYALHFAGRPPRLHSGARVRVAGVRLGNLIAMAAPETAGKSFEALTVIPPNTYGEQHTLVMLVNFSDNISQPYSVDYARDVVFNTTSAFDFENSYQQTWLSGDVAGWFTIPVSSSTCDTNAIATAANAAAAAAGFDLSAYGRYVYGFPSNACGFWGLATVGGNPSMAWINGDFNLRVVGHEMGHNFGLYHSHSYDCGGAAVEWTGCSVDEYGDTADIMGAQSAHFNAFQKERLGWLNYGAAPAITLVQAGGVYWLDAYETASNGNPKALKIFRGADPVTGEETWYYLEYRQAVGFDGGFAGNSNLASGIVIRTASESDANKSYLLDLTPETASWWDPALSAGGTFVDPDTALTINVVSLSAAGASVAVNVAPACVRANPSVVLAPTTGAPIPPGGSATYSVTVANNDSTACAAASFSLQATVPAGWIAGLGAPVLTLNPGARGTTTLNVTASARAANGSYAISVAATNATQLAYGTSSWATVVVSAPLAVTVRPDRTVYARLQTVAVAATVRLGSAPVAGAAVTLSIIKPTGAIAIVKGITASTGSVVLRYKVAFNDPRGTYQARVDASTRTASGSGVASFTVR